MIITAYEDAHMIAANVALLGTAAYFIATLLVLVGAAWVWNKLTERSTNFYKSRKLN